MSITAGTRVYVTRPAYGKPFYGVVRCVHVGREGMPHTWAHSSHHGELAVGYLIGRSDTSGALWYDASDFRPLKRKG